MISVEEAYQQISASCKPLTQKKCALEDSLDLILAENVVSPINMPPFRQSAMDGYALHVDKSFTNYELIGEIAAGSDQLFILKPGEAVRIFTGAPVPESANCVVQQEIISRKNNFISCTAEINIGMNIRGLGEQIKKDEIALEKNSILNPAAIGYLATLGITEVSIIPKPKIAMLTTGNELVKPGTNLKHGQIFESNSIMVSTVLQQGDFGKPHLQKVHDDLDSTRNALSELLEKNDVVLISGGISVGDYDYVKEALQSLGVKEEFHKIKQKPGKPIFFGTKDHKLIFALPGNPASALTCLYIYVLPALHKISGKKFEGLKKVKRKLIGQYKKKAGMAHYLKAISDEEFVKISDSQSSAMLNSFALANSLLYIPQEAESISENEFVDVFLF